VLGELRCDSLEKRVVSSEPLEGAREVGHRRSGARVRHRRCGRCGRGVRLARLARSLCEARRDQREQAPRIQRLRDVRVHSRREAARQVLLRGARRERDDREWRGRGTPGERPVALERADAARGLEAIDLGELTVHEHQVVRARRRRLDRREPVLREIEHVARRAQDLARHFGVDGAVLDQENARPALGRRQRSRVRGDRRARVERGAEHTEERGATDGLRACCNDPRRALIVLAERAPHRGEHHDARGGELRVGLDAPGEGEAVHLGHLVIDDGQRIRRSPRCRGEHLERLGAARRDVARHPRRAELGAEQLAVRGVVVDGQDAHLRQVRIARARRVPRARAGRLAEGQLEPERRPLSRRALEADGATHPLHQLAADGEAEARPAVLARGGRVHLRERLEELLLRIERDANARVAHRDPHARRAVRRRGPRGVNGDLPLARELHRVAHEVHQHLA
jgi:hypothetical protein